MLPYELRNEVVDEILSLIRSRRTVNKSSPYVKDTVEEEIYLQGREDTFDELIWMIESEHSFENNVL